jgi:hypothetical protein
MATDEIVSTNINEINAKENELLAKGYREVNKFKQLEPYEYFKNQWSGSEDSFHGSEHFQITWWIEE